jgi:hypothetical protein
MIVCPVCSRSLPKTMFPRDRTKTSGLASRCVECDNERNRVYYAQNQGRRVAAASSRPPKLCKTCATPLENRHHWYCEPCRRARKGHRFRVREARRRPTQERGYGWAHQKERLRVEPLVDSGRATCSRCAEPIIPGQPWDLDHFDDRSGYRGPAHRSCNRAAGAAKGNRERVLSRAVSEAW